MKSLFSRIVAATLILLAAPASAQSDPGLHIIIDKNSSNSTMSLSPGIYVSAGLGAQAGGEEPRAFAVRITQVSRNEFSGSLELIRLDRHGELVRETSELTGVVGNAGMTSAPGELIFNGTSPLTVKLQSGPLQVWMNSLEGNMTSTGFRLSWKLSTKEPGYDKIGSYGVFAMTTENGYQQTVAMYREMSSYKKLLMVDETSSSDSLAKLLESYMQSTDRWLSAPQGDELDAIKSKAGALYAREKKLLAGKPANNAEAVVLAMQIDAYYSQIDYIGQAMDKQDRYQRGAWFTVDQTFQYSACMEGTSPRLDYSVSPSCDRLPALFAAATQRWHEVNQALAKQYQLREGAIDALGCLRAAAHHLIEPNIGIPPSCERTHLLSGGEGS